MQRLIYVLLAVAMLAVVGLTSTLVLKRSKPTATVTAVAPVRCADADRLPGRVLPALSAAPLTVVTDQVTLHIDGATPGPLVAEGVHAVEATADGAAPARVQVEVAAFVPVLLEARVTAGVVTVLVVGARCATCAHADTEIDLKFRGGGVGDLGGVARSLAKGDWVLAAQQARAIAPDDRQGPEPARLLAVLYALAGRPTLVREQVALLPRRDPLVVALARRELAEAAVSQRQLETATARWNATSDRFQRLTDRFVSEAPQTLTELTVKFDGLSRRFASAQSGGDAIACEATLDDAAAAVRDAVVQLRTRNAGDCAWQRRISDAF